VLQAARGALPLASAAHRSPERLAELDHLSDAFLSSPVANRASCAQGRALLSSAIRSFLMRCSPRLTSAFALTGWQRTTRRCSAQSCAPWVGPR
jgi:hypothetical protein